MCNIVRTDKELEMCPYCFKNYLFFSKSNTTIIDVFANRKLEKKNDLSY
jgi:hypothetical protein